MGWGHGDEMSGTGHYLNGERHGVGFSYEEDGTSYLGTWKHGQKIGYTVLNTLVTLSALCSLSHKR